MKYFVSNENAVSQIINVKCDAYHVQWTVSLVAMQRRVPIEVSDASGLHTGRLSLHSTGL